MIASGVVLDAQVLIEEINALKLKGILKNPRQLLISDGATLIMPYHKIIDQCREERLGAEKIGTTGRGIGPAYEDRASRKAILFRDLFNERLLKEKLKVALEEKNFLIEHYFKKTPVNGETLLKELILIAEVLKTHRLADPSLLVTEALQKGRKVLFEGAQGTLLDPLHGTYPFVTSSPTVAGGAFSGVGIGATLVQKVVGITKAYTTRVGTGPFPTELHDSTGEYIQKKGKEFGATTGRRRRCGWLDLVALRYAIRLNGITSIALMKIDVLTGLDEIKLAVGYKLRGKSIKEFPTSAAEVQEVVPVYKKFKGWSQSLDGVRKKTGLPREAKAYIKFIEVFTGVTCDIISTGPDRDETIWVKALFKK